MSDRAQKSPSKESPGMSQGILGTFLDVVTRLFRKPSKATKTNEETNNQIKVVMNENRTLSISRSEVVISDETILVKGNVIKKQSGRLIAMGGHLHVVVMNPKGRALLNDVVRCELSQLKRKDLKSIGYTAQFPTPRESIDFIKIVYHDHNHSQCSQWGCKKRT